MLKVAIAGSTGYVGKYVVREAKARGHWVRALSRSESKLSQKGPFEAPAVRSDCDEVFVGEVTKPETLLHLFDGIDIAFSSIGISRQRDGLTFEQVDYQANKNLITLAKSAGVKKFVYVSLWDPSAVGGLAIVRAHEKVVAELEKSGLSYSVVRPAGYFSDMGALLDMARRGRSFVIGSGNNRMNPVHGADVARACVDAFESGEVEIGVGGPDVLTQREAAELAFEVLGKRPRVTHLPVWLLKGASSGIRTLSRQFGDLAEFIVTAGQVDGVAPCVGTRTLRAYFEELSGQTARVPDAVNPADSDRYSPQGS